MAPTNNFTMTAFWVAAPEIWNILPLDVSLLVLLVLPSSQNIPFLSSLIDNIAPSDWLAAPVIHAIMKWMCVNKFITATLPQITHINKFQDAFSMFSFPACVICQLNEEIHFTVFVAAGVGRWQWNDFLWCLWYMRPSGDVIFFTQQTDNFYSNNCYHIQVRSARGWVDWTWMKIALLNNAKMKHD